MRPVVETVCIVCKVVLVEMLVSKQAVLLAKNNYFNLRTPLQMYK